MNLNTHLRHYILLTCLLGKPANLINIMRQRLLAIHMLAHLYSHHGRHCVEIIRRRYSNGVDIFSLFFQHPAEIAVLFRPGILVKRTRCMFPIYITKRYNVLRTDLSYVARPHTTDADTGDI